MLNARRRKNTVKNDISNDNCCIAPWEVSHSACRLADNQGWGGDHRGCVFRVGDEMYFVPTQEIAGSDRLYITCDAQKIEGAWDWNSPFMLGDQAATVVEDAILNHLTSAPRSHQQGEAFVITRDGKTFRL